MKTTNIVSAVLRVIVAGIALVSGIIVLVDGGPKVLLTFTVQSNAMMAVSFLWTAHTLVWRKHTPPEWLSGSSVFYLAITGIVYNFVLRPESPGSSPDVLFGLSNSTLTHVVTPIAAMAIWIVFDEHRRIPWRFVWIWLVYLVAYLVVIFTVIAGVDSYSAPYPFLDVTLHGVGGVAWRLVVYMSCFAVLSAAMITLDHVLSERTALSEFDPHDQKRSC
ncbi:MAG: Pr6Pr family membrane protein [Demequinaceae bacterium]|nr:Pr6Pr family membrane protein [Demequinaceae bacterium]